MNPDEIKRIVETAINIETRYYLLYILLSGIIAIIVAYTLDFFKEKGKNLATKQDIQIITNKVEQVKADIYNDQEIEKLKRGLKYNALLNSLTIIDSFLSNFLIFTDATEIKKQFSTAIETRQCHNNLILTCENPELLTLFGKIMNAKTGLSTPEVGELLKTVNQYRNMVRKELGFGKEQQLDLDNIWFANVNFEPKK